MDLQCTILCGMCLECGSRKQDLSRELRAHCITMYSMKDEITPRLRSLFKRINGAHVQFVQQAWEMMEAAVGEQSDMIGICSNKAAAMVEEMCECSRHGTSSPRDAFNIFTVFVNDHREELQKFCKVFGPSAHSSGIVSDEYKDAVTLAAKLFGCCDELLCWLLVGKILPGSVAELAFSPPSTILPEGLMERRTDSDGKTVDEYSLAMNDVQAAMHIVDTMMDLAGPEDELVSETLVLALLAH